MKLKLTGTHYLKCGGKKKRLIKKTVPQNCSYFIRYLKPGFEGIKASSLQVLSNTLHLKTMEEGKYQLKKEDHHSVKTTSRRNHFAVLFFVYLGTNRGPSLLHDFMPYA